MRTIKFRAKCEDKGVWRYGYLLHDTNGRPVISKFDNDMFVNTYGCIKGTEGQFTGLLDKNGREIYEGDVVKWWDWDGNECLNSKVVCESDYFHLEHRSQSLSILMSIGCVFEVIGNIHENPELL